MSVLPNASGIRIADVYSFLDNMSSTKKYLRFDRNWNGKLMNTYFTTFRTLETAMEKDLSSGDIVQIYWEGDKVFDAEVRTIMRVRIEHILSNVETMVLACTDTGLSAREAYEYFRSMTDKDELVVYLLKRK